jgi:phosphoglycolate phosphatase-like HAD superfamily hydrolase
MTTTTALVIFDLDGTLSDATHRQHLVQGKKKNFTAFYEACGLDKVKIATVKVMHGMFLAGFDIWVWSGRSDEVEAQTIRWLKDNGVWYMLNELRMRKAGDYTPDDVLKMGWYDALPQEDKERLLLTFDDRDRMVAAWRGKGVVCFQVAPGNF